MNGKSFIVAEKWKCTSHIFRRNCGRIVLGSLNYWLSSSKEYPPYEKKTKNQIKV